MIKNYGTIKVFTGPMFAAKTSMLLNEIVKNKSIIFKPTLDTRYAEADVVTHDRISAKELGILVLRKPVDWLPSAEDLDDAKCFGSIGIDEAQFFKNIKQIVETFSLHGVKVFCACLNVGSNGKPLAQSADLLTIADEIEVLKSVCTKCKQPSNRTYRKKDEIKDEVLIGGAEMFEPYCFPCWHKESECH